MRIPPCRARPPGRRHRRAPCAPPQTRPPGRQAPGEPRFHRTPVAANHRKGEKQRGCRGSGQPVRPGAVRRRRSGPPRRRAPRAPVGSQAALARVQPHQVVQPVADLPGAVPAGHFEQPGPHELVQQVLGLLLGPAQQRGRGPGGDIGGIEQAEQAEQHRRPRGQLAVAEREAGPHAPVCLAQLGEPALLVGEPVRQVGRRVMRGGSPAARRRCAPRAAGGRRARRSGPPSPDRCADRPPSG